MTTMTVHRVAHATIRDSRHGYPTGPYIGLADFVVGDLQSVRRHPAPWRDGLSEGELDTGLFIFGFQTAAQLTHWFAPAVSALTAAGFVVWEVDVDDADVRLGRSQLMFLAERATFRKQASLYSLTTPSRPRRKIAPVLSLV